MFEKKEVNVFSLGGLSLRHKSEGVNIFPFGGLSFFASIIKSKLSVITVPSRYSGYESESSRLRERSQGIYCFHSVSQKESESGHC